MLTDRPLFIQEYESPHRFRPDEPACYIYGSIEERSALVADWDGASDVEAVKVEELESAVANFGQGFDRLSMRDSRQLEDFLRHIDGRTIYIDVTGLSHRVWAPLIRACLALRREVKVVYVEPEDYRYSASPVQSEIFDLSERIEGVAPIPGFASLSEVAEDQTCFVPLLGFEGARFAYLREQIEPLAQKTYPIIGVPGFRAEYPFHSYFGNQIVLTETRAWRNVRLVRANCPFSLYFTLEEIMQLHPGDTFKVGLIGTKPHAIGAVLCAIAKSGQIELVFDHPKPKPIRTSGAARRLCYSVSKFMEGRV